jgi:hypothetical protein
MATEMDGRIGSPLAKGTKVRKVSGKPFKSQRWVNTVRGVEEITNPAGKTVKAYVFDEDDSFVACDLCVEDTMKEQDITQREKEICQAADDLGLWRAGKALFILGAKWADEHPKCASPDIDSDNEKG